MKPSRRVQRGFGVHPDWVDALHNVRIVLVGITHPGNIGAVARVMKNMALGNLMLVSSTECGPETEAFAMSSGAYEIIEQAKKLIVLSDALSDCVMAVGTSGRLGGKRSAARPAEELIPQFMEKARSGPVACLFGRESRGLTNEELKLCTHQMIIPTNVTFASLNVAHAAAIVGYEIFKIAARPVGYQALEFRPASVALKEEMYQHIESVLLRAGFLDPTNPLLMMRDLRRIFNSAQMDERDVNIIRGVFRKVGNLVLRSQEKRGKPPQEANET